MFIQTLQDQHCESVHGGRGRLDIGDITLTRTTARRVIYGGSARYANNGSLNARSFNVRGRNATGSFNVGPTTFVVPEA